MQANPHREVSRDSERRESRSEAGVVNDTGRKDEKSKAHERTRVKELGKMHT